MATQTAITIIDHEGNEWRMRWEPTLDFDADFNYCAFCDETLTEGWVHSPDDIDDPAFILCAACADGQDQA